MLDVCKKPEFQQLHINFDDNGKFNKKLLLKYILITMLYYVHYILLYNII